MDYYLGLDIGGMSIKCGLTDKDGSIVAKQTAPTPVDDVDACVAVMADLCTATVRKAGLTLEKVAGVGIGAPGTVYGDTVTFAPNIGWHNVAICRLLQAKIGLPVRVGNDANCALLAEHRFGVCKGCDNVAMVTLGTGIGTAFVCDGKLLLGNGGAAGEGGHIRLYRKGKRCACGRLDCWELYASASALEKRMQQAIRREPGGLLAGIAAKRGKIDCIGFFEAVAGQDDTALTILDVFRRDVVEGLATVANLFRPQMIVMGGGISQQAVLVDPMESMLNTQLVGGVNNPYVRVVRARFDNDAGIIGAAVLAMPTVAKD